jgi:hypothetical protein
MARHGELELQGAVEHVEEAGGHISLAGGYGRQPAVGNWPGDAAHSTGLAGPGDPELLPEPDDDPDEDPEDEPDEEPEAPSRVPPSPLLARGAPPPET